jgi:hypothetical protein
MSNRTYLNNSNKTQTGQPPNLSDYSPREVLEPLTAIQAAAGDLYNRGLNVFPVPGPREVLAMHQARPDVIPDPLKKPSYGHKFLFTSRMLRDVNFYMLFRTANLACMLGRTSGNLIQIDCDSAGALETILHELHERHLPTDWAYLSHEGRGSILLRVIEGEVNNQARTPYKDVSVYGCMRYCIMPHSTHPTGEVYRWLDRDPLTSFSPGEPPPAVPVKALEWLGVTLAHKRHNEYNVPPIVDGQEWTRRLSMSNRRILHQAINLVPGERNINLTKPLYDVAACINSGHATYHQGLTLLQRAAEHCDYERSSITGMLRSALKKDPTPASEYHTGTPAAEMVPTWQRALVWGLNHQWSGRTAQTDRVVFMALVERCKIEGDTFRASVREIATLAGKGKRATHQALRRFTGRGPHRDDLIILEMVTRNMNSGANVYRFYEKVTVGDTLIYTVTCNVSLTATLKPNTIRSQRPTSQAEKDLFSRQLCAWRLWRWMLLNGTRNKAAMSRGAGLTYSSTRRALSWLLSLGLVQWSSSEGLWYGEPASEAGLADLAASLDLTGVTARRERAFQREREAAVNRKLIYKRAWWDRMTAPILEVDDDNSD